MKREKEKYYVLMKREENMIFFFSFISRGDIFIRSIYTKSVRTVLRVLTMKFLKYHV